MTVKAAEYLNITSLEFYIVASQDEPLCWVWERNAASREFPKLPAELRGRDCKVPLVFFGIELPLAEIFARIGI